MIAYHAAPSHVFALTPPAHLTFSRAFAPSMPAVAEPERPYRQALSLNGRWQFAPEPLPVGWKPNVGDVPTLPPPPDRSVRSPQNWGIGGQQSAWSTTAIKIPSPWNVNAFNKGDGGDFRCYPSYPASWEKVSMGWLKRSFTVPSTWSGKRLILHFEAVAGDAVVYVNRHEVAHNFDLFLPFEADVTADVKPGVSNEVLVSIRKASLFDDRRTIGGRPYPAGSMWGQAIVGIWQDVTLEAVPEVHVTDAYVQSKVSADTLTVDVTVRNDTSVSKTVDVGGDVRPWVNLAGKSVLDAPEPKSRLGAVVLRLPPRRVSIGAGASTTVTLSTPVHGRLKLWSPDSPTLYALTTSLSLPNRHFAASTTIGHPGSARNERIGRGAGGEGSGGVVVDARLTRFGWREYKIDGNRLLLNGKPIELRGDSWHFLGIPQMTRRYAWSWFTALKAAHGNAVRLHAQPYPALYLDMADEMGVCVLDETAIWGSDAGHKYDSPDFWNRCDDHVRRLVLRDRDHPSVFGWSVSNELGWYFGQSKREDLKPRLDQAWRDWLSTCRTLDPSRPWVSTDGDGDADGIMPTYIAHYANPANLARPDKPYGEGETGGAYYATPKYAAKFIGSVAYRSQEGRMEGIAHEAAELIDGQRKAGASYVSVFNLAWYGLQPLELGLSDTSRPYTIDDGIRFGPNREDTPGVQPERLGPYCSTFNPGYDPRLPLYRKWRLADAIAAAYAPTVAQASLPVPNPIVGQASLPVGRHTPAPPIDMIVVLAGTQSTLTSRLTAMGANVVDVPAAAPKFVVVDGADPPSTDLQALKSQLETWVTKGATCLMVDPQPGTLDRVNALLPRPIALTDRKSSSLIIAGGNTMIGNMTDADFYFTETINGNLIDHGLAGPFVDHGHVILEACPTDWRRWNNRPEPIKTAAALRSEREAKPLGPALVVLNFDSPSRFGRGAEERGGVGPGRYVVSTLDLTNGGIEVYGLLKTLLSNAGVQFKETSVDDNAAFDMFGYLRQAMVCGSFPSTSTVSAYDVDNVGVDTVVANAGDESGGVAWKSAKAGVDGAFDLLHLSLSSGGGSLAGARENASAYLSFYVWSPRPLDNLLVEPNMPKLDLLMGSDDGCQVYLNGKLIKEDRGIHPLTPDSIVGESLPLQRGWNHFVVKVVQVGGGWGFTARLRCSDPKFMGVLRTSVVPASTGG